MQLVAYGAQDIYLTGNPQITFFKVVYRRHTNFSMETIQQTIQGSSTLSTTSTANGSVTISRNGDLIHKIFVSSTFAGIMNGDAIVEEVELEIGGQQIDKQTKEWMQIFSEITLPEHQSKARGYMVGSLGHKPTVVTTNEGHQSRANSRVIIPLHFWFCRNPGLALPLIALQYHEVKLNFTWGIGNGSNVGHNCAAPVEVWCDYIYLDTDERRRFAQVSHEYLIEQVQFENYSTGSTSYKLNFNHPVKELIWFDRGDQYYVNAKLELNGHDRFEKQSPEYFRLKQLLDHHTRVPETNMGASRGSGTHPFDMTHGLITGNVLSGLGTTVCTATEFNMLQSTAPSRGYGNAIPQLRFNSRGDDIPETSETTAIKGGTFTTCGSTPSEFMVVNALDENSPFKSHSLAIGTQVQIQIQDAAGGIADTHGGFNHMIVNLYRRNGDTSVAPGTGPIAAYTDYGTINNVVDMDNTSIASGCVVIEFDRAVWNNNSQGGTFSNGDILRQFDVLSQTHNFDTDLIPAHTSQAVRGNISMASSFQHIINCYSFALKPEEHQPSGTCNFSRIDTAKIIFDTSPRSTLTIYAVNYNVLRIMSGMGGLAYSN